MDIKSFSKRMIELMPQCIRGFHSYESNYLSSGKISLPQFWALEFLSRKGPTLMNEIASFLNVSRPAATGIIDKLIVEKLVSRHVGEDDRRSVKVEITLKGKKIVSSIWQQKRHGLEKVFSKISNQDRRQHLEILERVVKALSSETCVVLLGFVLLGFFIKPASADEPLTLKQCYQLALKRSEAISIDEQLIKETEGQFWQSLNGLLPQVNYQISNEWQDRGSNDNPGSIRYRRFTFSQALFSGFKEFAAIASSKAQHKQREHQLERAKQLLFTDVSDAFYYFESYQEDLQAIEDIHKALVDRVSELKRRQGLGRTRESEVASAEASLYKSEADEEGVRSQLEVGRQLLEFLIGQPVLSIKDEELPNDSVMSLDDFLKKADQRLDVKAALKGLEAARRNITVARAGFWPTVNLNGDSYNKRTGSASDVDWDITLSVNVPIFNGTQTVGLVKQAQAQEKEAESVFIQSKRNAVLDIQNAYTRFTTDQKRELAIKKAADASDRNYKLQALDYRKNLVNNLDVLQALQDWETGHREYVAIKNEAKRYYWNLKVAVGDISHDVI
ncbi:MAG: TolC family protein [Candidatus Omnitrophica bacterium]|nr:TolC family protein [Candidatus Omnitrophota bacterium]